MAEEKKTPKKTSKDVDVKVVFDKDENHSKDKECPLLEEVIKRTERRIDNLEEMIDEEMNPLHRVELEAKRSENVDLLCYLKSLSHSGPAAKLLRTIFGE